MIILVGLVVFILGIVGGILLLSRGHRFLPYVALLLGFAICIVCIVSYDNGWGDEKREVEALIEACIGRGGDPQFLIDNYNQDAKFYGCVKP